ncbi:MAG: hypothetical protein ACE5G8_13995, partial [Anaerolineae bacterium]
MKARILPVMLILLTLASCRLGPPPAPTGPPSPAAETTAPQARQAATDTPAPTPLPPTEAPPAATPTPEPAFPPLALATSPEQGAEAGLTDPVEITFDQPMNRDSVAAAFAVDPPANGDLLWVSDTTLR